MLLSRSWVRVTSHRHLGGLAEQPKLAEAGAACPQAPRGITGINIPAHLTQNSLQGPPLLPVKVQWIP